MEKNIKEAISIIEYVMKSMPECTNKTFLKGALNELNEAFHQHDVSACVHPLSELVSGDEGLFCCKCQKYVRSDSHIH